MIDTYFSTYTGGGELFARLMESARQGHLCLEVDPNVSIPPFAGVVRENNRLYLKRNWVYETRVLEQLKRLSRPLPPIPYHDETLNAQQHAAIQTALSYSVSVITGGPGTGKTFLARHLIRAMGPEKKVALVAPTGKAASCLKHLNPEVPSGTLHAMLQIRSERDLLRESSYLAADLILVDESSMIDAQMLGYFLASIPQGGRIVFLGDADQLPPVESGTLFADLVDLIPTARLRTCMRSDRAEIAQLAAAILEGRPIATTRISLDETLFPLEPCAPEMFDGFRYLSCVRGGPWGVDTINDLLFERLRRRFQELPVPIMITRNDSKTGLYNGDMGVLLYRASGPAHAIFPGGKKLSASVLPPYEKAYCLSVHKSQGSEFDRIALLVPPGSEVFGREILYTGVTRARHAVQVDGDPETILKTLERSSRKRSGLRVRWKTQSVCV